MEKRTSRSIKPRIIIHGGCGNITPANLPPKAWHQYKTTLLRILHSTDSLLSQSSTTALDAAVHAVELLQLDPLFNAGRGAVFDRSGHVELEASVMVSRGFRKRGVAVSMIKHVKSPVGLAREILLRGQASDGGGAQGHVHLSGQGVEELAKGWGLEMCEESYFYTKKRWEEHRKGLEREKNPDDNDTDNDTDVEAPDGVSWPQGEPGWDGMAYLPQGTVGCVVLDSSGTLCVATSTGGITNKVPGRIGDTPTFGSGFWAEEWLNEHPKEISNSSSSSVVGPSLPAFQTFPAIKALFDLVQPVSGLITSCLPHTQTGFKETSHSVSPYMSPVHGVALGGTGNGDSFLQLAATRTCAARSRFGKSSLGDAITWMAGPNGELQRSAGDRWHRSGEGEGGMIGIEMIKGVGKVVYDFNCGGMFRTYVDDDGEIRVGVFREMEGS